MSPELARLILAQICIHGCMAGMRMAAPLLALQQGFSPAAVGVLLALFALTQVFLALPAGRLADKHGLKLPITLSVLAACTGAGLAAAMPNFAVLCVAALLTGGATGAAVIALQRHVGRLASGGTQLRQVFSWLSLGPAVSNFVGPVSCGLLIDHAGHVAADELGFRMAFLFVALLPLVSLFLVQTTRRFVPDIAPAATPGQASPKAWDLLRQPMFRRLILVNWFLSSCWDVHTFVVPILGFQRGLSAASVGAILGALAVAATVVRLLIPVLAAHLKEWKVIMTAMLATAALFGIYPLLHNAWAMGICSALLGLALGSVQPMVMSTLHQITPPARQGEAIALRLMTINSSSVLMPMLFGTVGAAIGVASVFWAVGAVVGLGARAAWLLQGSADASAAPGSTVHKS